jgi:hypothetical protein
VDPDTAPLVCRMFETYATGRFTLKEVRQQVAAFGLVNRERKLVVGWNPAPNLCNSAP